MIRRCAKHQPNADSYGTAARNGARALAYTSWGIGDFQSDHARASGVPDVIYPAMKLLEDAPICIPNNEPVREHRQEYFTAPPLHFPQEWLNQWRREAERIDWRPIWEEIASVNRAAQGSHRTGEFMMSMSDLELMHSRASLLDHVRVQARSLPAEIRPPDNAEYVVEISERNPFAPTTSYHVRWSEP